MFHPLNLGCGRAVVPGMINLDIRRRYHPDVVGDIEHLPFLPETIGIALLDNVLEHVDAETAMAEVHRVLRPGGRVFIRVPHYSSRGAWIDPTHRRAYGWATLDYWEAEHPMEYFDYHFKIESKRVYVNETDSPRRIIRPLWNLVAWITEKLWNILLKRIQGMERWSCLCPIDGVEIVMKKV